MAHHPRKIADSSRGSHRLSSVPFGRFWTPSLDDWRRVLRRAWSIRFSLLAAAFTAAEVVVPLFGDVLPRGAFVLLAFAASIGATVARIVAQPEMHR